MTGKVMTGLILLLTLGYSISLLVTAFTQIQMTKSDAPNTQSIFPDFGTISSNSAITGATPVPCTSAFISAIHSLSLNWESYVNVEIGENEFGEEEIEEALEKGNLECWDKFVTQSEYNYPSHNVTYFCFGTYDLNLQDLKNPFSYSVQCTKGDAEAIFLGTRPITVVTDTAPFTSNTISQTGYVTNLINPNVPSLRGFPLL